MSTTDGETARRVLVTGGSGMLGSHVVDRLLAAGCETTVLDLRINSANLGNSLRHPALRTIEGDVRDRDLIAKTVADHDVVVHLAAMLMSASTRDPRAAFEINVSATQELIYQCVQAGVSKLVLGSTVGVYGVPFDDDPIDEQHPIGARTFYGASKFANELFCRAYSDSFGLEYVALRLGTLYGDRLHPEGFYPGQLLRLIDSRDEPAVEVEGDPDELHDFLYVGDAADAVLAAVLLPVSDVALNIVSGHPVTWAEIVRTLFASLGSAPRISWRTRESAWAPRRRFDATAASQALGFTATTSLSDGLRRLVDWRLAQMTGENSGPTSPTSTGA